MLSKLFKKRDLQIYAPLNGDIVPLEQVPDRVFSQKMIGEGLAINPSNGNIHAPVDGEVIQLPESKHAVGIRAKDGTEILIHIGLETVALEGEGFTALVKNGDKVAVGDRLIEVDWASIEKKVESLVTPLVITNSKENKRKYILTEEKEAIKGKTVLITSTSN